MSAPPPIGTSGWNHRLRALGVDRKDVDLLYALGMTRAQEKASASEPLTAHDISFNPRQLAAYVDDAEAHPAPDGLWARLCQEIFLTPGDWQALGKLRSLVNAYRQAWQEDRKPPLAYHVLETAAWILHHQAHPDYAVLMYVRLSGHPRHDNEAFADWFVDQLAAMLVHGPDAVTESADYALGVDFFEDPPDAELVVPRLLSRVTQTQRDQILERSGGLAWPAKRDFYLDLLSQEDQHASLAQALRDSFFSPGGGTIDIPEAYEIFSQLDQRHEPHWWSLHIRNDIVIGLTQPLRAWVKSVIELHPPMPQDQEAQAESDALVALAIEMPTSLPAYRPILGPPSWFEHAELYLDDQRWGQLTRIRAGKSFDTPFAEPAPPHKQYVSIETEAPPSWGPIEWHAMKVDEAAAADALVGCWIELWPPTMHDRRPHLPAKFVA